jgi:hypothetical protein
MCWLCIAIGIILGIGLVLLILHLRTPDATFLIDQSDPEKDSYKLNLGDLDKLPKKRFVLVKVVIDNSQE